MSAKINALCSMGILIFFGLFSFQGMAKSAFEIDGKTIAAGQANSFIAIKGEQRLPVTVINGLKSGPVLLLTAGIHGDEFPAMFALQRLAKEVDAKQLKGTLIIIHVANLDGFHGRRIALNPLDEKNLNREFPGDENGTATEQLAAFLTDEFISKMDFLIDMHSGRTSGKLLPHVYSPFVGNEKLDKLTFEFAKATGMQHIVMYGERPRDPNNSVSYPNTGMTRGKPSLTTEIGHLGQHDEKSIKAALKVAYNGLYFLDMLPGKGPENPDPVIYEKLQSIASPADGFFTAKVGIGALVKKGDVVATINDYFGNKVTDLTAPVDATVLMINDNPAIKAGEKPVTLAIK